MSNKVLVSPIKSEKDYEEALNRVEELWGSESSTPEGDELDILVTLIENYEEKNYHVFPPDPIEAIKFRMEQMGIGQKELGKIIGNNRASEILNNKRDISLGIIKKLNKELKIPLEVLIV